jgi:hypothetical protein
MSGWGGIHVRMGRDPCPDGERSMSGWVASDETPGRSPLIGSQAWVNASFRRASGSGNLRHPRPSQTFYCGYQPNISGRSARRPGGMCCVGTSRRSSRLCLPSAVLHLAPWRSRRAKREDRAPQVKPARPRFHRASPPNTPAPANTTRPRLQLLDPGEVRPVRDARSGTAGEGRPVGDARWGTPGGVRPMGDARWGTPGQV